MISIENLTKSYGGRTLLDNVSCRINSRERVGVVGRNGHGKTTLFRLITGETRPDDGTVVIPKNYSIGYVEQQIAFTKDTVLAEGVTGLLPAERDHHWKVEKILFGLGFTAEDMQRPPESFSGGYQVRLNLAKVLVSEPDLLLLDEPTNYLDITSIRWITRFLNGWPRELMVITHDRGFMDRIVTHTLGIHRRKIRKIPGDTEKYYSQIAQDEEIYEKTRVNDAKRQREVELFISRFRAKARLAGLVQSRIKTLAKMEKKDRLETLRTLEFSFRAKPFPGKHVMQVDHLDFSYDGDRPVIRNLSFSVGAGDRICVVGPNGKGKTTLLKLLAGGLTPRSGEIAYNPNATLGVFDQTHVKTLVDTRTVEEEILYANADVERQAARNICGAMMFSGDEALKRISVLSGGERSRVMLGKLLVTPVNVLLLDEPTNHLDMDACDALLAAIDNFDGTVIMVTHNEMFLHALAERLIVFRADGQEVFPGGYQAFLDKGGWQDEEVGARSGRVDGTAQDPVARPSKKDLRRMRSEIITQRGKALKPLEDRMTKVERQIEQHDNRIRDLNAELVRAAQQGEGSRISGLSRSLHAEQAAMDDLYDELEKLSIRLDRESADFDGRIAELDDPA